ncbi:MAG: bifunctional phosphopantothenoylcysteine decarboxylase/phosphopantothenate synthase [Gemmataceae bacterium]|nr:bifunctional phosphopantothenoylcysteine decarboxylase/phosphopantothenate synthase [Gemmataceae bacterium]
MDLLVTAGNTQAPIDRVRCITNIFSGRTGAALAAEALRRGHRVALLTSHPREHDAPGVEVVPYRTFDDLRRLMQERFARPLDAAILAAAVSDYLPAGTYAPSSPFDGAFPPGTAFRDAGAGKIKSDEPELWLRLVRAPKLVDLVRTDWAFRGILVKFKLEVGLPDDALLEVAERSRRHSGADLMVANTLEGAASFAFIGPLGGVYERVYRGKLAERLIEAIEEKRACPTSS